MDSKFPFLENNGYIVPKSFQEDDLFKIDPDHFIAGFYKYEILFLLGFSLFKIMEQAMNFQDMVAKEIY